MNKRIDLVDGLESILALLQHRLEDLVEVERDYGEIPPILCYPDQLGQVFMHLVVNALEAMDRREGGPNDSSITRRLSLRCGVEDQWVVIRIADTGAGIPEQDLQHVFDPGFTTRGLARKLRQGAVARRSEPRRSGHVLAKAYWLYGEPAREPLHRR